MCDLFLFAKKIKNWQLAGKQCFNIVHRKFRRSLFPLAVLERELHTLDLNSRHSLYKLVWSFQSDLLSSIGELLRCRFTLTLRILLTISASANHTQRSNEYWTWTFWNPNKNIFNNVAKAWKTFFAFNWYHI